MDILSLLFAATMASASHPSLNIINQSYLMPMIVMAAEPNAPAWPAYQLADPPRWTWTSCVEAAKWMTGRQGTSWGAARYIKADTEDPMEARFILTTEGAGHIAVIASQDDDTYHIRECNWKAGRCSSRDVPKDASFIRGLKK